MSQSYVADVARALLDSAIAGLAQATTGRPVPATTFISHGPPPLYRCCDGMLTVHMEDIIHDQGISGGGGGVQHVHCAVTPRATFIITVARCWPTFDNSGQEPDPDDYDDATGELLEDLWCLLTEIYDRMMDSTLFPGQRTCEEVVIGAAEPLQAEGQCAGWTVQVMVDLNGTGPVGS